MTVFGLLNILLLTVGIFAALKLAKKDFKTPEEAWKRTPAPEEDDITDPTGIHPLSIFRDE